ncbi:MAG: phosphatidate cytidylyltransferase [Leptolyngbyaceae cyanobacterium SM1_1_3]|nr:phosphatidate cytidylyltransferase [Leptolyngbyaceae cyanobacterium SM1_1_3]NJN02238.1 phosphatidate cytidylyltransferase [Leptolyngbyaceae cyanobacterium RM1_1_2]NJO08481.1 phosphatidate cytidylyltransferase [Leptolyngbyaceae cyanobacterium SL_1_1]
MNSLLLTQSGIVVLWIAVVGIAAVGLRKFTPAGSELVRKVVHIGVGNVILIAWWLSIPAWLGIWASVLFSAVALISYQLPLIPGIDSVGRKSLGTFFYAVSIGVLIAWFWPQGLPQYAVIGVLIMTWGDGLAALVGQSFGAHPYQVAGMQKSLEGSLAMAVVGSLVCLLVLLSTQGALWQTWLVAVVVGLAATGLEAFSKLGIDNLTVPIGSAAIAFYLNQFLLTL